MSSRTLSEHSVKDGYGYWVFGCRFDTLDHSQKAFDEWGEIQSIEMTMKEHCIAKEIRRKETPLFESFRIGKAWL